MIYSEEVRLERDALRVQLAAKAAEIAALIGERDRQYEYNVAQIAKQAELEAQIAALREALLFVRLVIELHAKESRPGSSDRATLSVLDAANRLTHCMSVQCEAYKSA